MNFSHVKVESPTVCKGDRITTRTFEGSMAAVHINPFLGPLSLIFLWLFHANIQGLHRLAVEPVSPLLPLQSHNIEGQICSVRGRPPTDNLSSRPEPIIASLPSRLLLLLQPSDASRMYFSRLKSWRVKPTYRTPHLWLLSPPVGAPLVFRLYMVPQQRLCPE